MPRDKWRGRPEMARYIGAGAEVDAWALGILAYELLFGVAPFQDVAAEESDHYVELACVVCSDRPLVLPAGVRPSPLHCGFGGSCAAVPSARARAVCMRAPPA